MPKGNGKGALTARMIGEKRPRATGLGAATARAGRNAAGAVTVESIADTIV